MEGGKACPYCGSLLDSLARHAQSCMSGGDHTIQHNCIREVFYNVCERGGLRPESEVPRLQKDVSAPDGSRRPADVLVLRSLAMARQLPNGSATVRAERVALDFAVVNALGQGHWADTLQKGGLAVETYHTRELQHLQTAAKCAAARLRFQEECPRARTALFAQYVEQWP